MNRDVATSHRVLPLAIAIAAIVVVPLYGQRPVLTVGGQNPQFTDLPAAVAAAAPGSVLHVRAGTYTGFVTNKPLRILLDFTAQTGSVVPPTGSAYAIEVHGIPAGETFAIVGRGARITTGTLGAVRVANSGGHLVLTALTVAAGNTTSGVDAQNAACVLVERSAVTGTPALQAQDAVVVSTAVDWSSPAGRGIVGVARQPGVHVGQQQGLADAGAAGDGWVRAAGGERHHGAGGERGAVGAGGGVRSGAQRGAVAGGALRAHAGERVTGIRASGWADRGRRRTSTGGDGGCAGFVDVVEPHAYDGRAGAGGARQSGGGRTRRSGWRGSIGTSSSRRWCWRRGSSMRWDCRCRSAGRT